MKRGVLWVVLLFALPSATAEEVQSLVFDDDQGDVVITTQDNAIEQPDPTGFYANVDLVGGGIWAEDDDTVTFYLQADDLTQSSQVPLPFSDPDYYIYFHYGEQGYRVFVATSLDNPTNGVIGRDGTSFARLERQVDEFRYSGLAQAEVEMDFSSEIVQVTVPRDAIRDHNEAPLARNATLHSVYAEGRSMGWFGFPIGLGPGSQAAFVGVPMVSDRAPDAQGGQYTMKTGTIQQRGDLFAVSDDPIRWTNGEATTVSYDVQVTNLGDQDIDTQVAVTGTAGGWTVSYSDVLTVPAASAVNTTVLVSIPFGHQHGATDLFEVGFASSDDQHKATAVLGVHWPAIPQPAGHHDRLWFHSLQEEVPPPFDTLFGGVHGWFSAKEDLDDDAGTVIEPDFSAAPGVFGAQEGRAIWILRLEPALRMGLDFEPGRTGTIELGFQLPVPVVDPTVDVQLLHTMADDNGFGGDSMVLMQGTGEVQSGPISGGLDQEIILELAPGVDDIPYDPTANLLLFIDMRATFLAGAGFLNEQTISPTLDPTVSTMQLPLNEYSDPAGLTFQTDGSLAIQPGQHGQERFVNPGRTVVYTFDLDYTGADAATFEAVLSGNNVEWGSIIGDTVFDLGGESKRTLAVAVLAPEDARQGDQADVTLTLRHQQNAAIQAGIRTLTTVTTDTDIPDESDYGKELAGELTEEKESPGLGVLALLVAVALFLRRDS